MVQGYYKLLKQMDSTIITYETQHRNVPHKKASSGIPNTYITTQKTWVSYIL